MDITVYLPDEIGQWAKGRKINFSQRLRAAIEAERKRSTAVAGTLTDADIHILDVQDKSTGHSYTARLHGTALHGSAGAVQAYLGKDEMVWIYDGRDDSLRPLQDRDTAIQTLRRCLSNAEYIEAMEGLGEEAVIDVGQAATPPADEALAPFDEEAIIDVGRAVTPPTSAFAGSRGGKPRYTNGVCCGWRFTQAGGQARANCQAPNACARRVRAGWLPGIGDPAAPHNLGLPTTAPHSTPLTVAQAKALQQASKAAGYIPALKQVAVNPAALAEALAAAATPMATA